MTRAQFRQQLSNSFSIEELKTLCFDLDIDYDTIAGEDKVAKIRELIKLIQRQDRMPELLLHLEKWRPNKNWDEILQTNQVYDSITKRNPLTILFVIVLCLIAVAWGVNHLFNQPPSGQKPLLAASFEKPVITASATPEPTPTSPPPTAAPTHVPTTMPTVTTATPTATPTASVMPSPRAQVVDDSTFRLGPGEVYGFTFPNLKNNEIVLVLGRTVDSFWLNIIRDDEPESRGWVAESRVELLDGWELTAVPIVETIPPLPTIQPQPTIESATATATPPPATNDGDGGEDNNPSPVEPTRISNP